MQERTNHYGNALVKYRMMALRSNLEMLDKNTLDLENFVQSLVPLFFRSDKLAAPICRSECLQKQ